MNPANALLMLSAVSAVASPSGVPTMEPSLTKLPGAEFWSVTVLRPVMAPENPPFTPELLVTVSVAIPVKVTPVTSGGLSVVPGGEATMT